MECSYWPRPLPLTKYWKEQLLLVRSGCDSWDHRIDKGALAEALPRRRLWRSHSDDLTRTSTKKIYAFFNEQSLKSNSQQFILLYKNRKWNIKLEKNIILNCNIFTWSRTRSHVAGVDLKTKKIYKDIKKALYYIGADPDP